MKAGEVEERGGLGPSTPILEQPMPHSPVLPSHLTPTPLRPRSRPSRSERVRIRRRTKLARLPTRAQFEYPKASREMAHPGCNRRSNSPARSSTAARPRTSRLALHTSGCTCVVLCIGDWECARARSGCKCQYQRHRYFRPPSVVALAPPALADAALTRPGTTHNGARLEQRTAGLLHGPKARDRLPQRLRTRPSGLTGSPY